MPAVPQDVALPQQAGEKQGERRRVSDKEVVIST